MINLSFQLVHFLVSSLGTRVKIIDELKYPHGHSATFRDITGHEYMVDIVRLTDDEEVETKKKSEMFWKEVKELEEKHQKKVEENIKIIGRG